jgi:site-specific recombinase XerD
VKISRCMRSVPTDDADKVVNALMGMPPNASKKKEYVGLSTAKILVKAHSIKAPKLAARTIDKYLDRVHAFFNDAVRSKYIQDHPFQNRRVMKKKTRGKQQIRSSNDVELKKLFDPSLRAVNVKKPHQFWGPLIALYSGMRVNEIAQLYIEDIHNHEGTWEFLVRANHPDQKHEKCCFYAACSHS